MDSVFKRSDTSQYVLSKTIPPQQIVLHVLLNICVVLKFHHMFNSKYVDTIYK